MSNSSKVILAAIIILILAGAYYLLAMNPSYNNPSGSNDNTPAARTLDIAATEFRFAPDKITVRSGERVRINFKNSGTTSHNLILDGLNAATQVIAPGKTTTLDFTAPAAGDYNFYCSVNGHKDKGMRGTLTVE